MISSLERLTEDHPVSRRYLVGVSGGLDSVVLLHGLHQLGYKRLVVVHLNHALRGRQSGADAAFVRRLAKRLGYPIESKREDVARRARERKLSLETAARDARYAFFAEVGRRHRCRRLFLAHHADDQVETVLMNAFRGAGVAGLGGMRALSSRTVDGVRLEILRPFLETWREELREWAEDHGLRFREDDSNADRRFLRNRVRHDLLPLVATLFQRDPRRSVLRLARQAQGESDYLEDLVSQALEKVQVEDGRQLRVWPLRHLPETLQRRLVHGWLKRQGVRDVGFELVDAALQLVVLGAGMAKINLPGDRHLRRRQGRLFIE